jgi:multidrug efflux pump subunit AcrA (membrane-fusion protein)
MTAIAFFGNWAIRSAVLIGCGELLVRATRVKDPAVRLAVCQTMLVASLAIPLLTAIGARHALPMSPLPSGIAIPAGLSASGPIARPAPSAPASPPFDWALAAGAGYLAVSLFLLLRLATGAALSLRVSGASRPTGRRWNDAEVRESDRVAAPVTMGILTPKIVLPGDWRQWSEPTLNAVLAHEGSHIRRFDPLLQFISAIHRALLWVNPLSWYLHRRIVRLSETVSDDAALAGAPSRTFYAELLLNFMRRNAGGEPAAGIAMARYGPPDERIHRILDGVTISRGVGRWAMAAIVAVAAPVEYAVVAAHALAPPQAVAQTVTHRNQVLAQAAAQTPAPAPVRPERSAASGVAALGNVTASYTIVVKPRVEGQLLSISAHEGEQVHAGQLLATLDAKTYEIAAAQADAQLAADEAQLRTAPNRLEMAAQIASDQAKAESAHLLVKYAQITAPADGMIGLQQVDPGNFIHPDQPMFVITQLQPIAVRFSVPEDYVTPAQSQLRKGLAPRVEAWNRDNTKRLAAGRLTAIDNQIDTQTGTIQMKAEFENQDGALFPNQFVNVRLFLDGR